MTSWLSKLPFNRDPVKHARYLVEPRGRMVTSFGALTFLILTVVFEWSGGILNWLVLAAVLGIIFTLFSIIRGLLGIIEGEPHHNEPEQSK